MDVTNETRAKFAAAPYKDKTGRSVYVVMLKYTFAVDPLGKVEIDDTNGAEPRFIDEYHGDDPSTSSIKHPSDFFDEKPGTDVLLLGHAYPPMRGSATRVDVSLTMGPIAKTLRVHGLRVWKLGTLGGLSAGPALTIRAPIPLRYELSWGGMDLSDPTKPVGEPRNYVGRGVARDVSKLVGERAAQIEYPNSPAGDRACVPGGFGALHRHWQPRASFAGTYDDRWMDTKLPLLPDDFDARFHVAVPLDQWSQSALRGDEPIEVRGATPEGVWRFQLPRCAPGFSSVWRGARTDHRTHLDTVLIDADAGRVELTYRAAIPLPRKLELLDGVDIIEKEVFRPAGASPLGDDGVAAEEEEDGA